MKLHSIKIDTWIKPDLLAQLFSKQFGTKGLSWLDSDSSENGEWSIIGVNPKEVISCKKKKTTNAEDSPFNKLQKIKSGFWIGWLSYEAGACLVGT